MFLFCDSGLRFRFNWCSDSNLRKNFFKTFKSKYSKFGDNKVRSQIIDYKQLKMDEISNGINQIQLSKFFKSRYLSRFQFQWNSCQFSLKLAGDVPNGKKILSGVLNNCRLSDIISPTRFYIQDLDDDDKRWKLLYRMRWGDVLVETKMLIKINFIYQRFLFGKHQQQRQHWIWFTTWTFD